MQSAVHQKHRHRPEHARSRAGATPLWRVGRFAAVTLAMAALVTGLWLGVGESSSPPTVAVVGDSITALSRESIERSLDQAGYKPTVDAVIGIETAQAQPLVDQLAQQNPTDWIIELGTNDAGQSNSMWPLPFLAQWQQVRSSACVIYLSVSPHAGPIANQINVSLAKLAQAHTNVHILNWGQLEYANPAWLEPDKIHPTPAGQVELADLETQELRQYC